jgi:CubicO group peptidase (beta-lactamase class C family)
MKILTLILCNAVLSCCGAQVDSQMVDSIRQEYHIPELAFAIVTSDSIVQSYIAGTPILGSGLLAKNSDCFHLGSNTKAVTAFIAAELVKQGKLKWDTRFFELFPELEPTSNKVYKKITLEMLLTYRGKVPPYTYTFEQPYPQDIKGKYNQQRYLVAQYFLQQKPMKDENGLTRSNVDYILAGLMIEKASGKSYEELLNELGNRLHIRLGINPPATNDSLQVHGHDSENKPVVATDLTKLNWLLCAGNVHINLRDYQVFIQEELRALNGKSELFTRDEMNKMLFGFPHFSMGWFNFEDGDNHIAHNAGNAANFRSDVRIIKEKNCAIMVLMNASGETQIMGMQLLIDKLNASINK